jgi:hypothetical protein
MRKRGGMRRMLWVSDVTEGCAVLGLVVASWWGLDFSGGVRLELWSLVHSVGSDCAARVPEPVAHKQHSSACITAISYLLLQPDYTGPFLLQQTLIFFSCRIVETGGYVRFFPKGLCRLWCINDT